MNKGNNRTSKRNTAPSLPQVPGLTRQDAGEELRSVCREMEGGRFLLADETVAPVVPCLQPQRARLFVHLRGARRVRLGLDGQVCDETLQCGDVVFLNQHTWHQPLWPSSFWLFTVIFDPEYTLLQWKGEGKNTAQPPRSWLYGPRHTPSVQHTLQALSNLPTGQSEAGMALAQGLLHLIVQEVETCHTPLGRARATFEAIRQYAEENYARPINRETLAREFGLHPNHVTRLFREHAPGGVSAYLTGLRMEHALQLLRDGRHSVQQIAALCGFESANYFGKVFRKTYGCSPGQYGAKR